MSAASMTAHVLRAIATVRDGRGLDRLARGVVHSLRVALAVAMQGGERRGLWALRTQAGLAFTRDGRRVLGADGPLLAVFRACGVELAEGEWIYVSPLLERWTGVAEPNRAG